MGKLFNNAGKGNYLRKRDIGNVIRYILRQRKKEESADELIAWGGFGVPEWRGAEGAIEAFEEVQKMHIRNGRFGRYIDHEYFDFTDDDRLRMEESNVDMDIIAREMAQDFYQEGTQVIYGIHEKMDKDGTINLHVHFAVNTVDYRTGKKRRENMSGTRERSMKMNEIMEKHIKEAIRTRRHP